MILLYFILCYTNTVSKKNLFIQSKVTALLSSTVNLAHIWLIFAVI